MIHLHTHSMYSLRDSIIRPEELVARLKEVGQDTVAITDHGSSLGGVSIYKLLKDNGIKYIHGCEFYICPDASVRDKENKYYHLVVLCKNETGRLNLNKLISLSEHPDHRYFKPRIDFNMLSEHGEGLIVMSACLVGEVSKAIVGGDIAKARDIAKRYKERFGDDYYLEIQSHRDPEQIKVNKAIIALGEELGIECVVTSDAHYTWEKDKRYQNKYAFNGAYKEDGEAYVDCFIQSEQEVRSRLQYLNAETIDRVISNTHVIAAKCNVEMPLSAPIMPQMQVPPEFATSKEWLMSICEQGFRTKLNIDVATRSQADPERKIFQQILNEDGEIVGYEEKDLSSDTIETYLKRYEYELDSLTRMGFLDYMLLVYSYANVAKRRGIARGSGGGSLICYVTNITNIDPIEHKLYFERFIDVGALKLLEDGEITQKELKIPDVDLDFSGESCDEVLRFLYDTYGESRVASIGKFGTNKTKGTIRDMCKVLDIDLQTADEIAKAFNDYEIDEIDAMIAGELDVVPSAQPAIEKVEEYPELFDYVRKLNGLPKSFGLHACGKIIANQELDYYLPSSYDADGIRFLQGDMHSVEDVGLVKIDVLGLRTLDQEYDTLEMSGESAEFINPKQDYGDPKVLDIFRTGDTLGIFQFSSHGMKQTLKKMNVSGIDDLSVVNALFRPGAMGYIDNYCNRKLGKEKFTYLHPDLENILNTTYGIIVFQEQLIEIGRLAGMHNPDLLRKATGKKNPKLLAQVKPELEEKLKARGWTDEQFTQLWTDMLEFSHYSFNKCVSGKTKLLRPMIKNNVWHPTVEEMYLTKNSLEYAKSHNKLPLRSKYNRRGYGTALSMYEDGRIRTNTIVDIQPSGLCETITIRTESGAAITCTANHKFPTPNGTTLAGDLTIGSELYLVDKYEPTQSTYNCWCCNSCHKKDQYRIGRTKTFEKGLPTKTERIVSITTNPPEMTYDITMSEPAHNFVVDSGIVTCNSHAAAYAILAYITAKQKAYYPTEFYCGLCNSYVGQSSFVKDDAQEIIDDILNHKIRLVPFNFRQDHRKCRSQNGEIVWGIPLLRDCNQSLADALYELRSTEETHFWRIAASLCEMSFRSKLDILVKLGFFSEYGTAKELLRILDLADKFKMGNRTTIKKQDVATSDTLKEIVARHATCFNTKGEELKSYKITDCAAILDECEDYIHSLHIGELDAKILAQHQKKYIGAVAFPSRKETDARKLFVRSVYPCKRKKDGVVFAYNVGYVSLGSGKSGSMTVFKTKFEQDPIAVDDIVVCKRWERDRGYFRMLDYEKLLY